MQINSPSILPCRLAGMTEAQLCDALEVYCREQSLPHESADELVARDSTTRDQQDWLSAFNDAWDSANAAFCVASEDQVGGHQ